MIQDAMFAMSMENHGGGTQDDFSFRQFAVPLVPGLEKRMRAQIVRKAHAQTLSGFGLAGPACRN